VTFDEAGAVAQIVTAIAAVAGLVGLVWQVRGDHERRKKQATIETWVATRDRRRRLRIDVVDQSRTPAALARSVESRRALNEWLSDIENFALGVNAGVFDLETIDRLAGSYFIRLWWWAGPWIKDRQEDRSPLLYCELETLALRITERREREGTMPMGGFYDAENGGSARDGQSCTSDDRGTAGETAISGPVPPVPEGGRSD